MRTDSGLQSVRRLGNGLVLPFSILISVAFLFFGCGRKGPPVPPRQAKLPVINDLTSSIEGDLLQLTWAMPGHDKKRPPALSGFIVHRSKKSVSEPECEDCPILFQRVVDIPIQTEGSADLEKVVTVYTETLEKGFKYTYKVTIYMGTGAHGRDSNVVAFTY
jgi:hypothetical protein